MWLPLGGDVKVGEDCQGKWELEIMLLLLNLNHSRYVNPSISFSQRVPPTNYHPLLTSTLLQLWLRLSSLPLGLPV